MASRIAIKKCRRSTINIINPPWTNINSEFTNIIKLSNLMKCKLFLGSKKSGSFIITDKWQKCIFNNSTASNHITNNFNSITWFISNSKSSTKNRKPHKIKWRNFSTTWVERLNEILFLTFIFMIKHFLW